MSLADIMSDAGLAVYAEVALLIFLLVFIGVVVRVFAPSRRRHFDHAAGLPFEDDASTDRTPAPPARGEDSRHG